MSDQTLDLEIRNKPDSRPEVSPETGSVSSLSDSQPATNYNAVLEHAEVSWWAYAKAYDLMCEANPAYQDNLALMTRWVDECGIPSSARICDLGAGTGNYLLQLARHLPESDLIHIDWNSAMTALAEEKYATAELDVEIFISNIDDVEHADNSLDMALCFNALYAFSNREKNIEKVLRWLVPGGYFLVMDMGRKMDTNDWARYMMKNNIKQYGLFKTLQRLFRTRAAFPANRHVRAHQDSGVYWQHSTQVFKRWLENRGFAVEHIQTCYRGIGDFAVCRKPG